MLEMCSGTSNYPWVTIWDIGMTYFDQFGEKCQKSQKNHIQGGEVKKNIPKTRPPKSENCEIMSESYHNHE